jgi:hypothetical protein
MTASHTRKNNSEQGSKNDQSGKETAQPMRTPSADRRNHGRLNRGFMLSVYSYGTVRSGPTLPTHTNRLAVPS